MKNDNCNLTNSRFTGAIVFAIVALWFSFALLMGAEVRYGPAPHQPPLALGLSVVAPIVLFVFAYLRRGAFWAFCQSLDLRFVVAAHLWRIMGIDFILCSAEGRLPAGFALPAGIGDMIAGLAAIPMAFGISSGASAAKRWFVAWNIFGLLDLVLAVSLGILHSPSSLGVLVGAGPATRLMGELPRSMVPTFLVPLFILLHLLALARRREITAVPAGPKENDHQIPPIAAAAGNA